MDEYFNRNGRKKAKRKRLAAPVRTIEEKPEPPLVYLPEKLEILKAANLTEAQPSGDLPASIHTEIKSKKSAIRVTADEGKALIGFYRENGFRPLWVSHQGLGERGRSLLRLFESAADDGMVPEDYIPPSLTLFDDELTSGDKPVNLLARLDLELSALALRYARHASGGRLLPNRLTKYYDIVPETVDLATAMTALLRSPDPAGYLRSLQPDHPTYAALKRTLAELKELKNEERSGMIAPGKRVAAGQDDPRIALMRRHLALLGYGEADVLPGEETVLDDILSERLKTFQTDARIKPTGTLDAATILALNSRTGAPGIARITYNMERLRWLPKNLGQRYVFVNQASYSLQVVDAGREIWRSNVIVGKTNSQTVAFSDKMETIVFNPSWGVPPSIMKNEMLPKLRRDPGYLDRIGYRVVTGSGKIVHSRSINWWKYKDGKVPYLILQPPGDDNALGEVKFLFPNAHSIYMHDTPTRELFKKSVRALSHGCVRVENPRRFAEILLGVDSADIAARIDAGVSQDTPVTNETYVHLAYFTAWPAADGRILFYDDIYGRDERMGRAFSTIAVASR
ncbi:L,D-transpeptidase family protein [Taklimakanibacter lacteus]|uniref:L,D-transpeptidase family protein n=1 Tax=Taklimakanibacter lacteus TaxID=2268456 RepID=UPI0013C4E0D9